MKTQPTFQLKHYFRRLITLLLICCASQAFGQSDSAVQVSDSANAKILLDYKKQLAELESQRLADSIEKAQLETKLQGLSTADVLQKAELEDQLIQIRNRDALRLSRQKARIDSLRVNASSYPVRGLFNDTLFVLYTKLGSFSADDRATAITERIKHLTDDYTFATDSIDVIESETTVDLYYGKVILMSISETDAVWNNTTTRSLAEYYKLLIGREVLKYKSETSVSVLIKEIAIAVGVIALTALLLFYLLKFFRWLNLQIESQRGKLFKGISIRNYTIIDAQREIRAIEWLVKIFKWFVVLILLYIAIPILFGLFPWTKNFAPVLFGYILNPIKNIAHAFWNYLPNLITIIVIVFFFRYVLKALFYLKTEIEKGNLHLPGFYSEWANPTYQIVRVLVFAFMIIVIFPYLPGSNSPVFQGVSVFLGFLFTFGSAGSLSNIVAGLLLTYMRLFKIGDRVKIAEVTGDVIEKSLLVTRIRTIKNEIVSIPNSTVMTSHTINYTSEAEEKGLIVHSTVTIGYDVPWRDMHEALIDAALKTSLIEQEPKPFVLQTSLDDFFVSYEINAYTHEANKQATIYSELHQHIQDVCAERGIEIMSPHYFAARDGNTVTLPAGTLPKGYKPPSFLVNIFKGEGKE